MEKNPYTKGTIVHSKDKEHTGTLTGGSRQCGMEGCQGRALGVRWDDGALTFPCSHGMDINSNEWYIK